ncbi:hypothetical protein DPMN_179403 [Dreissena polymorpha]|uniref:Uncharacterized protein n=1 Tax=Dreissena polymorpha TaxID=45954 RepID=A0A9D4IMB1_DREPO|nr:hypothetical protein DPMN_179403 [Dreissena polymorpha]
MRKLQVMRMLKNPMTSMMKKIEKVFLHLAQNLLCLGFNLNMDIKQGMTRMIMMMIWVIQIGFTIKESLLQTVKTRIRTYKGKQRKTEITVGKKVYFSGGGLSAADFID